MFSITIKAITKSHHLKTWWKLMKFLVADCRWKRTFWIRILNCSKKTWGVSATNMVSGFTKIWWKWRASVIRITGMYLWWVTMYGRWLESMNPFTNVKLLEIIFCVQVLPIFNVHVYLICTRASQKVRSGIFSPKNATTLE